MVFDNYSKARLPAYIICLDAPYNLIKECDSR